MEHLDIVFPENNEEDFLILADKLGIKLCFAYDEKNYSLKRTKYEFCCLYNSQKREVLSISDDVSRQSFENPRINMLFNLETSQSHDKIHQRDSNFNQVLAKICKDKNKTIGFNFNLILNADANERHRLLGRMMQNVKLCRKYKVKMYIGSFAREPYELRSFCELISFGVCLGMNPGEINSLVL